MRRLSPRFHRSSLLLAAAVAVACALPAQAAILHYQGSLSGPAEFPVNASPGLGTTEVTIDNVANTMRVQATFVGLVGNTTASHIHAPTVNPGTLTAGVATTTPFFAGFPIGVKSGSYDNTLDLTLASSYNPSYVTANGGTTAGAEAALLAAIAAGKAYLNIHSTSVPGGEIRSFLTPFDPVPTQQSSWARVKALYH